MSTFDGTFAHTRWSFFDLAGEALRRVFGANQRVEEGAQIFDEATLRELRRLDEQQLRDVGVLRRTTGISRIEIGRGMEPVAMFEYDYFRLRI